ncbi:MAG: energy transducer TonB [Spirochaetaceae bacterium]|jgi:protein TonB|nr:energy transducer TonB [Spirochaetaceae bacterium]
MKHKNSRSLVFVVVAAIHAAALFLIAFSMETAIRAEPVPADVMKLVDIEEEKPPPPPPEVKTQQNVTEAMAENLLETDKVPEAAVAAVVTPAVPQFAEDYVPQSKISVLPRFNESDILSKLVYPAIAQRSGIEEGRVVLELFINRQGLVTKINVLKEDPPERGFGEAAVRAFTGARATPAEANGEAVATRYRYPVRFQLK